MARLEILLATYNSARYLSEQLDSLFAQTFSDFTVLVSDDGSTDDTSLILSQYWQRFPERIRILQFSGNAGGASANFGRLLECSAAEYVMFCDHDDVWLPDKIAVCLDQMRSMEKMHGAESPLLVHTDLVVVGPKLERLNNSFWRFAKINPARDALSQLLAQNVVTGCTMLMNRALCTRASPIPPQAVMHDYWCALVAAISGNIEYIDEGTILYRQHGTNLFGAVAWSLPNIVRRVKQTLLADDLVYGVVAKSLQAKVLLARYGAAMTDKQRETTTVMANLWSRPRLLRFLSLLQSGITINGLLRNVALFVTVSRAKLKVKSVPPYSTR
jgi:glycosyltransferase involved in cell wall biosynthesis